MTRPPGTVAGTDDLLPVTFLEEEWVLAIDSRSSNHNLPLAIDIEGRLDRGTLDDVLRALTARQETLRMAFVPVPGQVQRVVRPALEPELETIDLSGVAESGRDNLLEVAILEEANGPTDLTRPPLWRGFVVRMAPEHHVLVTLWHHVIFDGWSSGVAFRDLTNLFSRALREGRPQLPDLEIQLADYAGWERQLSLPPATVAYWRAMVPGEPVDLPTEGGQQIRGPGPRIVAGRPFPAILAAQMAGLEKIARVRGVTLASALRSVVLTALRPYLPDRPVIGLVYGNRERPELQPLIGLLSDHLPVRFDLTGNPSFLDLISRVHDAVRAARQHRAPSGVIRNLLPAGSTDSLMFDVSINNMRHGVHLTAIVTAPDASTLRFSVRDIPTTGLWTRIERIFSGMAPLGYQLHHNTATGELTGDIWGHLPTFRPATLDMLGQDLAATTARILSDPEQGILAIAPRN